MAEYTVTIIGTLNTDDKSLDYLNRESRRFKTAEDVSKYVEAMMSDELAIDLNEIRVEEKPLHRR